jgi:hypothetical protein
MSYYTPRVQMQCIHIAAFASSDPPASEGRSEQCMVVGTSVAKLAEPNNFAFQLLLEEFAEGRFAKIFSKWSTDRIPKCACAM